MRRLVILGCLLAACSDPLPEVTRVDGLRVLGMRANPPELAPNAMTALTALVVDPAGRAMTTEYAVCDPRLLLEDAEDCSGAREIPLTPDSQGRVYLRPADALAALAIEPQPRLLLPIVLRVRAGADRVTAIKRIVVSPDAGAAANRNPHILYVLVNHATTDPLTPVSVRPGETVTLGIVEEGFDFEPHPSPDGGVLRERHTIRWYSSAGSILQPVTSSGITDEGPRSEENDLTLPTTLGDLQLWVVVTDGHGGTSWEARHLTVATP